MRVAMHVVIDVDLEKYRAEYFENFSNSEIRDMVKIDVHEQLKAAFSNVFDHFRDVEVK